MVVAVCSVTYEGRLRAVLPEATRLLLVKADGSVSIHSDDRAYKPLNWMSPPCTLTEEPGRWVVGNPKGETLTISLGEVLSDVTVPLGEEPGLEKDGVEAHLQTLLAADPDAIEGGLRLVRREHPTDIGPVDLLCRDTDGRVVVVEVKRVAGIDAVEQVLRYVERLRRDPRLGGEIRAVVVGQVVRPQAEVYAASRGVGTVVVDYDDLRGLAPDELTLF
jgi:RecB family endonuclease NucS